MCVVFLKKNKRKKAVEKTKRDHLKREEEGRRGKKEKPARCGHSGEQMFQPEVTGQLRQSKVKGEKKPVRSSLSVRASVVD